MSSILRWFPSKAALFLLSFSLTFKVYKAKRMNTQAPEQTTMAILAPEYRLFLKVRGPAMLSAQYPNKFIEETVHFLVDPKVFAEMLA